MKRMTGYLLGAVLGLALLPCHADSSGLQQLLQQVQQASQQDAAQRSQRLERFKQRRDQQAALLKQAGAQQAAAQKRVDAIKAQFKANQTHIQALQKKLQNALGDQGQFFAAVHDAAHNFQTMANNSLLSAQYPARVKKLAQLANATRVPNIQDIRELWFLMQQTITASGEVAHFNTHIAAADGASQKAGVTRIGSFTAIANGRYLAPVPGTTQLAVLARQPGHLDAARDFTKATAGIAPILVDPSRGTLLRRRAARPDLRERIDQAGIIGKVIIVIGLLGAALALYQFFYLLRVDWAVRRQLRRLDTPRANNPLGRVLQCLDAEKLDEDPELLETRISEAVLREAPPLERFQSFLRMVVAAGPLLGLLGTVSGMIITFQVITEVGAGDPKLMAGGISQAMVATVLGLLVAIPLLFVNSLLSARSRVLVQILDEQSAGLLTRRLEALRGD